MNKSIEQFADTGLAFLIGLTPAALGAAVSLAYEKGLTWSERFTQFSVGIIVSWFASRAIGALMTLDPFVLQAVTFTLGMIAFKTVPKLISSFSDTIASLPSDFRERLLAWLPKKKDEL